MNNALAGNPAVLGQLRQQLEIISDLIRQGQGGVQGGEEAVAGAAGGIGGGMGGNAVVLDMTLGPVEQAPVVNDVIGDVINGVMDQPPSSSSTSDDEQDDPTADPQQQLPVDPDADPAPLPPAAGGNLNAEVRRIRELVRSPEIQRVSQFFLLNYGYTSM